jgi:integrase/recombinase XerC
MPDAGLSTESLERLGDLMLRFSRFAVRGARCRFAKDVTAEITQGFIHARSRDGSAPAVATMHLRRATVRLLFSEGRRLGLVRHDPTLDLELPPRSSLGARPLTDAEVALCRSYSITSLMETRQPAAWALAEATARSAEVARCHIRDLDLERGRVWLHGCSKTEPRWGEVSAWGRQQIERRLHVLHGAAPDSLLICPTAQPGVSATSSASAAIADTLRRAGLHTEPDVRPPSVAAWAGAKAFVAGASIQDVARMLGIRSLDRAAAFIGFEWHPPEAPDRPGLR